MKKVKTITIILLSFNASNLWAKKEYDFVLMLFKCKFLAGSLVSGPKADLMILEADLYSALCTRVKQKIDCAYVSEKDGKTYANESHDILLETRGLLELRSQKTGGSSISINTNNGTAIQISKFHDEGTRGTKVCQGVYATASELRVIKK